MTRSFFLLAAGLLFSLAAFAQEPYFGTKPGRTFYYERTEWGKDKLEQTTEFSIDSIYAAANGSSKVVYTVHMKKRGKRDIYGGKTTLVGEFTSKGDVILNLGGTAASFIKNMFSAANVVSSGDKVVLPGNLKPGDSLAPATCTVNVAGVKYTIKVCERTVLREEEVTVPAGTFKAVVVRDHKIEEGPFHHANNWVESWYVRGYGYVRHDKYDKNMNPESSEVLISVKN